ncbi:MAG: hypothetical protein EAZ64_03570 [Sphingobacteriales bacterium]|nr:MAG: hypothetical protein EAZ64_03570 [Sphingobacteriales bacterium]
MKSFFLIAFCLQINFLYGQNYGYTYAKIPFVEYIGLLINNDNTPGPVGEPVSGVFINTGYAFKLKPNFYLETGVDYLLVNRRGENYFKNPNSKLNDNVLNIENSALAFQFRPLWRSDISADDNIFFFAAAGFNFQQLFSNATYTSYSLNNNLQQIATIEQSKSVFYWAAQPEIGLEYRNPKKLGFRFGVSYSYINWNRSVSKLKFVNNPTLDISAHRTSTLFFSFGFVY